MVRGYYLMNAEALRKVLDLERQRGYVDSAVFGGLDKFLHNWSDQAMASLANPSLLSRFRSLFGVSYASMDAEQRRQWVHDVLSFLDGMGVKDNREGQPVAAPVSPARKKSSPKVKVPSAPAADKGLDAPITVVRGISTALSGKFGKLGVKTVRDLLYFFPHRHLDYSQLKFISQLAEGEEQTIVANVWQAQEAVLGGRRGTEAIVGDETGNIRVVWFNQPYLAKKLLTNTRIMLSGRVSLFKGRHVFQSPEWEIMEGQDLVHTARLVPVYSLTQGLRPRQVRKLMKEFIDRWASQVTDFLPPYLQRRLNLLELPVAIAQAHYPDDEATKDKARIRLAFDELFLLQLGVMSKKRQWQESKPGSSFDVNKPVLSEFLKSLPFTFTAAQDRVLGEILSDLAQSRPMSRLLQGEVGSGKTVVAAAALLVAVANGYQGAFMAPTEILAEQHFATICQLLSRMGEEDGEGNLRSYSGFLKRPLKVALLIGDIKQAGKRKVQQQIRHCHRYSCPRSEGRGFP
jgi:ATP-dependent DNA helicase RecG